MLKEAWQHQDLLLQNSFMLRVRLKNYQARNPYMKQVLVVMFSPDSHSAFYAAFYKIKIQVVAVARLKRKPGYRKT